MAELTKERFKKVESDRFDKDVISRPTISYWGDAWRRLKKKPCSDVFSGIVGCLCHYDDYWPIHPGTGFYFRKWYAEKSRDRLRSSGLALTIWAAICFQESGWEPVYRSLWRLSVRRFRLWLAVFTVELWHITAESWMK